MMEDDSFNFMEELELLIVVSKGVDGRYKKHLSCKERGLTFGVPPNVFSPC
jgi:hypothetical protein